MARTSGISGLAVALTTAGGLLLYTAIKNTSVAEGLRDVLQGRTPGGGIGPGKPWEQTTSGLPPTLSPGEGNTYNFPGPGSPNAIRSTSTNAQIRTFVETAQAQLGKPYKWATAGPSTFDCSGLVTYCLKAAGLDTRRRLSAEYLTWSGATTMANGKAAVSYGDLVCWGGHVGIAIDDHRMIHAPGAGDIVRIANIWWAPVPVIRRIKVGG